MDNEFREDVKNWVSADNTIKEYSETIKELRAGRNDLSDKILQYAELHKLSNSIIKISDGRLRFSQTKHTSPLTIKYIESCLTKCIHDENDVEKIMNIIKESRESTNIIDIKRTYT